MERIKIPVYGQHKDDLKTLVQDFTYVRLVPLKLLITSNPEIAAASCLLVSEEDLPVSNYCVDVQGERIGPRGTRAHG